MKFFHKELQADPLYLKRVLVKFIIGCFFFSLSSFLPNIATSLMIYYIFLYIVCSCLLPIYDWKFRTSLVSEFEPAIKNAGFCLAASYLGSMIGAPVELIF